MYEYDRLTAMLISILDGDVLPLPGIDFPERCEQRVAIAVCEEMRMTPEHWKTLSKWERKPWIEKTIEKLASRTKSDEQAAVDLIGNASPVMADELPPNEARVKPEDVPSAFREGGRANGEILTVPYLLENPEWPFQSKVQFTRAYKEGRLTRRIKVKRSYAYLYTELAALWRDDSLKG